MARSAALPIGIYVGLTLSMVLALWIFIANRMPLLEAFDRERNLGAAALIGLFALVPILRYKSAPRSLLICGLAAWSIVTLVYRLLCAHFPGLAGIRSPAQVLMLGALFYLISATVAWTIALLFPARRNGPSQSRVNR